MRPYDVRLTAMDSCGIMWDNLVKGDDGDE
jgi:hypothetical protein